MNQDYSSLYSDYNNELKPLVSEIEGRTEMFEKGLLTHLATMFDEIALHAQAKADCQDKEATKHLNLADESLCISIKDSYQTLIMVIDKNIKAFSRQVGKSLSKLSGGRFVGLFKSQLKNAREYVNAEDYKSAYKEYSKLEEACNKQIPEVITHSTSCVRVWGTILEWLLSICISVGVGIVVSCYSTEIKGFMKYLIDWLS